MSVGETVERALSQLIGLPIWSVGRADTITWMQVGEKHIRQDKRGGTREVGTFALHLSCAWQWVDDSGHLKANDASAPMVLSLLDGLDARVRNVSATDTGGFVLNLGLQGALTVEPDEAEKGLGVEYWRLFQPGLETPHFVMESSGPEWHEA